MTETKPRRQRRTKASIVTSIEQAAECEIAQNGFISSLVTSIIKKAKIEPQVFYNRYSDITDFYDNFVKKYDRWLAGIIESIEEPIESEEGMKILFSEIIHSINDDPVILELIRWELFEKNPTTTRTSQTRETYMKPIAQSYVRNFSATGQDIIAIFAILIGGIYYISLHKKLSSFYGLETNSTEGRERVVKAVDTLIGYVHKAHAIAQREEQLKESLRSLGVSDDIIGQAFS